jgi:hypothetical protein
LETAATQPLEFDIYSAFSRNLMVDGKDATVPIDQYKNLLNLNPVYIPGTIGITVKEELYRVVAQERLIAEGRQNQVIRNLVYRLKAMADEEHNENWREFIDIVNPLFQLDGIAVPFDEKKDEWLTATYQENKCEFDFVSAGSGFLQIVNLLSFLFLHTSKVSLLDEPDSHMHDDLQRLAFDLLDRLSHHRNVQLIIATHSPTLIDAAGLSNVLIIDRECDRPLQAHNVETLVPLLGDRGLALPPAKVTNTLKSRKALFVEGIESDFREFLERLGEVYRPGFRAITRGLTIFQTKGSTSRWPFDAIACFQDLIGASLDYVYVSDRDFFTDEQVREREDKAEKAGYRIFHLNRRNRESYILEPGILSRVLLARWKDKFPGGPDPDILTENAIRQFILEDGKQSEDETRTTYLVQQEPYLRGDAAHRTEMTRKVNEYFRCAYTEPLQQGEIPYKLLDSQSTLKNLRGTITEQCKISFSDREVWEAFKPMEIPAELKTVLDKILNMFPSRPTTQATKLPIRREGTLWSEA